VTFDYWTFTGNSSLSVVTAGYADVLVVGGGGGGGARIGGGGGAGGYLEVSNAYLPVGTSTVTIGAGGAGAIGGTLPIARIGTTSRFGSFFSTGGGTGASSNSSGTGVVQQAGGYGGGTNFYI
jgi:hypothetical protein